MVYAPACFPHSPPAAAHFFLYAIAALPAASGRRKGSNCISLCVCCASATEEDVEHSALTNQQTALAAAP